MSPTRNLDDYSYSPNLPSRGGDTQVRDGDEGSTVQPGRPVAGVHGLAGRIALSDLGGKSALFVGKSARERKEYPIGTGFLDYFPLATAEVSHVSYVGNIQHSGPNSPLRWDRSKSADEADAMMRHFLQRGTFDTDGLRHSAKLAWRAMAALEKELEDERNK
jgi:hypothetical protein